MDRRIRRMVRSVVGLVADLAFAVLAVWVGWGGGLWVLIVAATVGALCLWNLNIHYRDWVNDEQRGWHRDEWLVRHLGLAIVGVLIEVIGALLLRSASEVSSHLRAGVGVLLILCGLVPVVQVVRARLSTIAAEPFPAWKAWTLNVGLIVVATVLPALVLAFNGRGLWFGAVTAVLWLVAELADRAELEGRLWGYLGIGLIVGPIVLFAFTSLGEGVTAWVLLGAFGVGLVVMAGRQRKTEGVEPSRLRGIVQPEKARWALLFALVLLIGGTLWLRSAVGGGAFPRGLFVAGLVVAVLFGASLVTRGEGLLLVVAVGLLAVWAVQDHTVADADSLPSGDEDGDLIVAFGDSYMSGEGTGVFITGTDVAGARTYSRGGQNECRRSPDAYAVRVAVELGAKLGFRACSGAKALTDGFFEAVVDRSAGSVDDEVDPNLLADEATRNSLYGQFLRWEADPVNAGLHPDLVLLSLGGNDAGFSKIGAACFMPGSCRSALDAAYAEGDGDTKRGRLAAVDIRVAATLEKAIELFPDTPMVVIAYPQMFGPATRECGGQVPFSGDEIDSLRRLVTDLNDEVATGISSVNEQLGDTQIVHFAGSAVAFGNERFCQLDDHGELEKPKAMNTLVVEPSEGVDLLARLIPSKLIHNTFHPTVRGHELVAEALGPFLEARCWEVANEDLDVCASGLRVLTRGQDPQPTPTEGLLDLGVVGAESGCDDLESFVRCALVRGLRTVVWPSILLVLAGLYLAMAADRAGIVHSLVGWLTGRPFRGASRLADVIPVHAE